MGGLTMGRRDALIALYAQELEEKCGIVPDMELLGKVAIGCGPAIYDEDGSLVAIDDPAELDLIRRNFLIRKLALWDGPELAAAIDQAVEIYGGSGPRRYRAVLYYVLVKILGREAAYS